MKLSFEEYKRRFPVQGWCVWDIDHICRAVYMCRWWAYPFCAGFRFVRNVKTGLYYRLNEIGVMKTPEGVIPSLSDIWNRR